MPLLNYTTKVPVDLTVNEIHKILAKAGANAILNEYDTFGVSGVKFRIETKHGQMFYHLPADINGVSNALKKDRAYKDDAHARRVAWRIIKDWIEAQMALITAHMAQLDQVFLPYAQTKDGRTVYQRISESGLMLLEGPR